MAIDGSEVFFIGENGQGKTNLLESIYFLCYGTSFRTREDGLLCKNDKEFFTASASFENSEDDSNEIFISWSNTKKTIKLNDKIVTDRKNIVRNLPCIIFSHDDITFVSGSPERRRLFLDQTLSLYNPYYIDLMRNYKKVLKTRNLLLKEQKKDLIPIYNEQLVDFGLEIQQKRREICQLFQPIFKSLFKEISNFPEDVEIKYHSTWPEQHKRDEILKFLHKKEPTELILGNTTTGPHRDKLLFSCGGREFSEIGSTGQLRLISLILRIIQADFFTKTTGRKPILLLDDVLLELDTEKRERILLKLPQYSQAFFTFLPNEDYRNYTKENTMVFKVTKGEFS